MSEVYDLNWKKFHTNTLETFNKLRLEESFTDVTLVTDDHFMIKAHKLVLIASSQYFHNLLKVIPASTPFICLDGVTRSDLKFLVEYLYNGEIKVPNNFIKRFLLLAKRFQVKGLFKENKIQNIKHFNVEIQSTEEIEHDKIDPFSKQIEDNDKEEFCSDNSDMVYADFGQNTYTESYSDEAENNIVEEGLTRNEDEDIDSDNYDKIYESNAEETSNENKQITINDDKSRTFRKYKKPYSWTKNVKIYLGGREIKLQILDLKLMEISQKVDSGYQCTKCGAVTYRMDQIKEHVEMHVDNLSFICKLCGYGTKKRSNLRKKTHQKHCGASSALVKSGLFFSYSKNLKIFFGDKEVDHEYLSDKLMSLITLHRGSNINTYKCVQCNFDGSDKIIEHVENHIENLCFVCGICGFRMRTHTGIDSAEHIEHCLKYDNEKVQKWRSDDKSSENENNISVPKGNTKFNDSKNIVTSSAERSMMLGQNLSAYIGSKEISLRELDNKLLQFATEISVSNNESVYQCKKCPVIENCETTIKDHIEKHVDNLSFVCNECGFRMKKREECISTEDFQFCNKMKSIEL